MEKIITKKISKEFSANHAGDIVFSAEKVYVVNIRDAVIATFNNHADYLMDNASEFTTNKEEFLTAMGKVYDAVVHKEHFTKTFKKKKSENLKRKINTLFGLNMKKGGVR